MICHGVYVYLFFSIKKSGDKLSKVKKRKPAQTATLKDEIEDADKAECDMKAISPTDTAEPPKDTLNSPIKDTAKPPKVTAKRPKDTDKPHKDTAKPPKDTAKPPNDTAKPPKDTVNPPKNTAKPSKDIYTKPHNDTATLSKGVSISGSRTDHPSTEPDVSESDKRISNEFKDKINRMRHKSRVSGETEVSEGNIEGASHISGLHLTHDRYDGSEDDVAGQEEGETHFDVDRANIVDGDNDCDSFTIDSAYSDFPCDEQSGSVSSEDNDESSHQVASAQPVKNQCEDNDESSHQAASVQPIKLNVKLKGHKQTRIANLVDVVRDESGVVMDKTDLSINSGASDMYINMEVRNQNSHHAVESGKESRLSLKCKKQKIHASASIISVLNESKEDSHFLENRPKSRNVDSNESSKDIEFYEECQLASASEKGLLLVVSDHSASNYDSECDLQPACRNRKQKTSHTSNIAEAQSKQKSVSRKKVHRPEGTELGGTNYQNDVYDFEPSESEEEILQKSMPIRKTVRNIAGNAERKVERNAQSVEEMSKNLMPIKKVAQNLAASREMKAKSDSDSGDEIPRKLTSIQKTVRNLTKEERRKARRNAARQKLVRLQQLTEEFDNDTDVFTKEQQCSVTTAAAESENVTCKNQTSSKDSVGSLDITLPSASFIHVSQTHKPRQDVLSSFSSQFGTHKVSQKTLKGKKRKGDTQLVSLSKRPLRNHQGVYKAFDDLSDSNSRDRTISRIASKMHGKDGAKQQDLHKGNSSLSKTSQWKETVHAVFDDFSDSDSADKPVSISVSQMYGKKRTKQAASKADTSESVPKRLLRKHKMLNLPTFEDSESDQNSSESVPKNQEYNDSDHDRSECKSGRPTATISMQTIVDEGIASENEDGLNNVVSQACDLSNRGHDSCSNSDDSLEVLSVKRSKLRKGAGFLFDQSKKSATAEPEEKSQSVSSKSQMSKTVLPLNNSHRIVRQFTFKKTGTASDAGPSCDSHNAPGPSHNNPIIIQPLAHIAERDSEIPSDENSNPAGGSIEAGEPAGGSMGGNNPDDCMVGHMFIPFVIKVEDEMAEKLQQEISQIR